MSRAGALLRSFLLGRAYSFAAVLFVALMVANLATIPQFVSPANIAGTLAVAAPFVLAAIASTPSVLSGGGGIDISIGPLLGFANVLFISRLLPNGLGGPLPAITIVLALSIIVGAINGFLVVVVRLQPIVATLGSYLVLSGLALELMPQPGGTAPSWIVRFNGSFAHIPGALILIAIPVVIWLAIQKTAYYRALIAVGGAERSAFSAGVNVALVRGLAYVLGGLFAGFAGLALTALVQSGDPTLGPQYTLIAITAVALGGTSLAGGRGGIAGSILGALSIFLIQNLLSALNVSSYWNQVVYGGILVVSLVINAQARTLFRRPASLVRGPARVEPT
ncbi:MAG: ABC transporter permease [Acidimicrobiales bacterium]|jgi:ribose transport system permease protein